MTRLATARNKLDLETDDFKKSPDLTLVRGGLATPDTTEWRPGQKQARWLDSARNPRYARRVERPDRLDSQSFRDLFPLVEALAGRGYKWVYRFSELQDWYEWALAYDREYEQPFPLVLAQLGSLPFYPRRALHRRAPFHRYPRPSRTFYRGNHHVVRIDPVLKSGGEEAGPQFHLSLNPMDESDYSTWHRARCQGGEGPRGTQTGWIMVAQK